ncbi:MAG: nuclear transport factor 2 family protein [Acidobacteria bacterium]|nr:nuclear transport factor 2 family protein [Acidobacteriota bacterium]
MQPDPNIFAGVNDLFARYARTMDDRRLDDCLALFADDAILVVGGNTHTGKTQIRAWMATLSGSRAGRHLTVNVIVDADDQGHTVADADFAFVRPGPDGPSIVVLGRYHDEVALIEGTWRFVHHSILENL